MVSTNIPDGAIGPVVAGSLYKRASALEARLTTSGASLGYAALDRARTDLNSLAADGASPVRLLRIEHLLDTYDSTLATSEATADIPAPITPADVAEQTPVYNLDEGGNLVFDSSTLEEGTSTVTFSFPSTRLRNLGIGLGVTVVATTGCFSTQVVPSDMTDVPTYTFKDNGGLPGPNFYDFQPVIENGVVVGGRGVLNEVGPGFTAYRIPGVDANPILSDGTLSAAQRNAQLEVLARRGVYDAIEQTRIHSIALFNTAYARSTADVTDIDSFDEAVMRYHFALECGHDFSATPGAPTLDDLKGQLKAKLELAQAADDDERITALHGTARRFVTRPQELMQLLGEGEFDIAKERTERPESGNFSSDFERHLAQSVDVAELKKDIVEVYTSDGAETIVFDVPSETGERLRDLGKRKTYTDLPAPLQTELRNFADTTLARTMVMHAEDHVAVALQKYDMGGLAIDPTHAGAKEIISALQFSEVGRAAYRFAKVELLKEGPHPGLKVAADPNAHEAAIAGTAILDKLVELHQAGRTLPDGRNLQDAFSGTAMEKALATHYVGSLLNEGKELVGEDEIAKKTEGLEKLSVAQTVAVELEYFDLAREIDEILVETAEDMDRGGKSVEDFLTDRGSEFSAEGVDIAERHANLIDEIVQTTYESKQANERNDLKEAFALDEKLEKLSDRFTTDPDLPLLAEAYVAKTPHGSLDVALHNEEAHMDQLLAEYEEELHVKRLREKTRVAQREETVMKDTVFVPTRFGGALYNTFAMLFQGEFGQSWNSFTGALRNLFAPLGLGSALVASGTDAFTEDVVGVDEDYNIVGTVLNEVVAGAGFNPRGFMRDGTTTDMNSRMLDVLDPITGDRQDRGPVDTIQELYLDNTIPRATIQLLASLTSKALGVHGLVQEFQGGAGAPTPESGVTGNP